MNIKVDFDNIVVKEDKNDFNVKILMLKGEKGEQGDGEQNVIEVVQVNGTALPVSNKTVNVQVPIVDSAISSSSTNPVQNKVIYEALGDKADTSALSNYYQTSEVDALLSAKVSTSDLENYYDKTQSYSKTEVNGLLNGKVDATTLQTELNTINTSLGTKANSSDVANTYETKENHNTSISTLSSQISELNSQVSGLASGTPLVASSVAGMTDTTKTYVNTSDGKWYYYDGDSWEIGGTYQATIIGEDEVKTYNLDTQFIKKYTNLEYDFNQYITKTQTINYSDTSNHNHFYLADDTKYLNLPIGRYMVITKLKVNSLTSGATIFFRQGNRYKLGSGSTTNYMVSENVHDATFTYQELNQYKYCWGTINATDTIQWLRPYVAFVNQSRTNPIQGEFYVESMYLFKVDENTDAYYNDILHRIAYYDFQKAYPIPNFSDVDKAYITSNITDDYKSYVDGKLEYVPEYIQDEVDSVIENFNPPDKSLSFIFQTDHHTNDLSYHITPVEHAVKSSNLLMKALPIELNLFGGDYVGNSASTTKAQYIQFTRTIIDYLNNDNFNLLLRGNHDINQMNATASENLTDSEIFNVFGKKYIINNPKVVTNPNQPNPMYGYIDFDFQKIRLIFVNTSDGYDQNLKIGMGNMNTTQLQWLADNGFTLPSGKTDYRVIVVGHYPIYDFSDETAEVEGGRLNGFKELLKAFVNGTNLSYTIWGPNYYCIKDFTSQGPKDLICYLCGHTHYDDNLLTSDGILQIATTNAGYYGKTNNTGTINELAYDIVTIDTVNNKIKFTRFGDGTDREFNI